VPLQCSFGTGPYNGNSTTEDTFYIDTKNCNIYDWLTFFCCFFLLCILKFIIKKKDTRILPRSPDGLEWAWVHCDRKFTGYYETDYTFENWEALGTALRLKNNVDTIYFTLFSSWHDSW